MEVDHPLAKKKRKHAGKTKKLYVIAGATVLLAIIGGVYAYNTAFNQPILDSAVVAQATFPVYAPSTLPEGYTVKKDATNINNGVLIYTLANEKANSAITVTVQPWPTGFNMSKMVEGGSINGTSVKVGTLYNLSTESSTKYLLDMGSTLIFLTSPKKVDASTIRSLADSLEKVN